MTLPASGAISFNNINVELGVSGTTQASLGQASYRTLAGVASGAISMSNFYGKANQFSFTISSNQTNANLRTLAVNAGWNQSSNLVATINSGVYCSSNSTGTPGLVVNGSFPNGVRLNNQGFIVGMGGAGGKGQTNGTTGGSGGTALSVSVALTLNNTGTIAGGGGGGGGGGFGRAQIDKFGNGAASTGGGGGGGRTGAAANSPGGAAGDVAFPPNTQIDLGGPGGAGTVSAAGSGGTAASYPSTPNRNLGGAGGGWGASGAGGSTITSPFDLPRVLATGGGGGGAAISGNSNITYIATGTRLGAIT